MTHSFRSHYYHLIWSTKNRKKMITPDIQPRLYAYIGGIIRSHEGHLLSIGGIDDHVHLLITAITPDKFSSTIRDAKSRSTVWIHETFPTHRYFSWQEGYSSFSISYSAIEKVIEYINNQKEHHKIITFEEEYLKLLKRHNIKIDERFVLG